MEKVRGRILTLSVVKLKLKNHAMLQLTQCERHIASELSDHFTFEVPGAKFMPAVKRRQWDGKIRLLNRMNGEINAGLYDAIKKFCDSKNYGVELEESPYGYITDKNKVNHLATMQWIKELNLPFEVRDYQYDAVTHALENKRCILVSPTGSGKSLIIYLLMRHYFDNCSKKKILVVVPTTSLVEQMYSDFKLYNFDVDSHCHKIYSGKDKDTNKRIVITTWQSIYKLAPKWFADFGCIFGDEVHGFKAKSLSSIMNKAINADCRYGTTGTLDGTLVNELVLEGLFGPVHKVTTTHELQKKEALAKLSIDVVLLQYEEEYCKSTGTRTYHDEIDFLVTYEKRNKFITNLALSQTGNTLVLFNLVDRHGKVLRDMMRKKLKDNQSLYYVSGETTTADREAVRNIVEKNTNSIILASLGTFSTGINIRNIHNIIFASPSKSQIRVLQSIGRGLRIADNRSDTKLYDIADDLHYRSKKNFTLLHSAERIKIYSNEKFPYKIVPLSI
jgi:superfamily II DNA or RNA helicase